MNKLYIDIINIINRAKALITYKIDRKLLINN